MFFSKGPFVTEPQETRKRWSLASVKELVTDRILNLDDSPHRIALGVFLGFLIAATPTIGIQMVLLFIFAFIFRANKFSGILPVWLSNPVTAVPLYSFNWWLGLVLLTGETRPDPARLQRVMDLISGSPGQDISLWARVTSKAYWEAAWETFVALGAELWVGSVVVGFVFGLIGYAFTYWAIKRRRQRAAEIVEPAEIAEVTDAAKAAEETH